MSRVEDRDRYHWGDGLQRFARAAKPAQRTYYQDPDDPNFVAPKDRKPQPALKVEFAEVSDGRRRIQVAPNPEKPKERQRSKGTR